MIGEVATASASGLAVGLNLLLIGLIYGAVARLSDRVNIARVHRAREVTPRHVAARTVHIMRRRRVFIAELLKVASKAAQATPVRAHPGTSRFLRAADERL